MRVKETERGFHAAIVETELSQLVDIAALLSLTANTPDAIGLADRKRDEALAAIALEQEHLDKMRAILALFPAPGIGKGK